MTDEREKPRFDQMKDDELLKALFGERAAEKIEREKREREEESKTDEEEREAM